METETDINKIVEELNEEQIKTLKQKLKGKSKYQNKGVYRTKENKIRFFNPDEWETFIYDTNNRLKFYYWFLFLTGVRYKEAKNIKIKDIDFANRQIIILKPKGDVQRYAHLSSFTVKQIRNYKIENNLREEDTFNFPTIQHLIQTMKKTCQQKKIAGWKDFSVHNLRKTHENYLIALNKDETRITKHMGHTMKTAQEHYLSSGFIKDKKQLDKIRQWLGDIFE